MFKLYSYFSYILIPLVFLNLFLRILKNKEDRIRFKERFGYSTIVKPKKAIMWIHAASIGEFKSAHCIIEEYYKNYSILITTTTKSASEYVNKYYFDKVIHQYVPFDINIWIKRFVKYWDPKIVLWIESDLWPNTLQVIKKNKIKSLFLNARISPKSFRRWKIIKRNYCKLLDTFSRIFAQSKDDQKRLQNLSNKEIEFIGNLKLAINDSKTELPNTYINNAIMFTSTHLGEEKLILPTINNLYKKYKKLKFYIAPRHPERTYEIKKFFAKNNLPADRQSEAGSNSRLIIIDKFGKLSKYFNISDIVFLGGSFSNNGGHNPIEPAKHNCAIISGKNIFNWQNIYKEMFDEKACYLINQPNKLQEIIENLINNQDMLNKSKINALNFSKNNFFDQNKLKDIINNMLDKNA